MEILSKITLKTIGCQPKPNSVQKMATLATIYGIAQRYKIGTSNYGEFTKFQGDFEAVRVADGETFRSAALLLPPIIGDMLRATVDKADDTGVQFGVEIGVKPSDVPIGYEYSVKPVFKTDAADALAHLRDSVLKSLPAPETPTEKPAKRKGK